MSHSNPSPEPNPTESDDEVIGKAFRISVLVILVALLVIAAISLSGGVDDAPPPIDAVDPVEAHKSTAVAEIPQIPFTDITEAAGIVFPHRNGATGQKLLPETMGSGVAFFDADGDGDADLLLARGTDWPWSTPRTDAPSLALFENDGKGKFTDVSARSGLTDSFMATGLAVGDFDGDGDTDVFAAAVGPDHLLRNDGGTFVDVTATAGVRGPEDAWSSSAAFFDADRDGDLDLFVANYVSWSRDLDLSIENSLTGVGRAYGQPTQFPGGICRLYRNDGHGVFSDVSASSGVEVLEANGGRPAAKALAVVPVDIDRDGHLDLVIANDTVRNFLFHNRGDGTFEEVGERAGIAYNTNGQATGAMGIDAADYRDDGAIAIAIGNFAAEMTSLFVSIPDKISFFDQNVDEGIGPPSRRWLSFGVFFFDADLDGWLDLFQVNGHLEDEIAAVQPDQRYRQPAQLFWHRGGDAPSCYAPVPDAKLGDLVVPIVGRGAAYADIDGDGDLDVCLTQVAGPPRLLRNDQALGNHWLRVRLFGTTERPSVIGTRVRLTAQGRTRELVVMPTRSYLSQVELPVTFGLGSATEVERLEVIWPDGTRSEHPVPAIDQLIEVRHP